jgi:hypothetical protein
MTNRCRALPLALALACTSPTEPSAEPPIVGPSAKADGAGPPAFFLCRVQRGDGDGFFRQDTLTCQNSIESLLSPAIDVSDKSGSIVGSMRLADGEGRLPFFADRYPLRLRAYGFAPDRIEALAGVRVETELAIASEAGWDALKGPAAPLDVWDLELEGRVDVAVVAFDAYAITAQNGGRFEVRGAPAQSVEVRATSAIVRAGETITVSVAAPTESDELAGGVEIDGMRIPIAVRGPGRFAVTREGLSEPTRIPSAGSDLVGCARTGTRVDCALDGRPGIEISRATVEAGGMTHDLPLDGTTLAIETESPLRASVAVAAGIEGIDLTRFGVIEGTLDPREERAALDLPFGLLHLEVTANELVQQAFFDARDQHVVAFTRAIGASFEYSNTLSIDLSRERTDVWIAVSPATTEIPGSLTVVETSGAVREIESVVLRAGAYSLSPAGLAMPSAFESGTELARCWLTAASQLRCSRIEHPNLLEVALTIGIESIGRDIDVQVRPDSSAITTLSGQLLPSTITLRARGSIGEAIIASMRVIGAADLPESAPLRLVAP